MSSDDIRIAWNRVTERLVAVHPDDGTYAIVEIAFPSPTPGPPTPDTRLVIGPTLKEIAEEFERSNHLPVREAER